MRVGKLSIGPAVYILRKTSRSSYAFLADFFGAFFSSSTTDRSASARAFSFDLRIVSSRNDSLMIGESFLIDCDPGDIGTCRTGLDARLDLLSPVCKAEVALS